MLFLSSQLSLALQEARNENRLKNSTFHDIWRPAATSEAPLFPKQKKN